MTPHDELESLRIPRFSFRQLMPLLAGVLGAALLGVAATVVAYTIGASSAAEYERMKAAGQEEVCFNVRTRSSHAGPCNVPATGALTVLAIGAAALIGFGVGFKLGGGRISAEYAAGARAFLR